MANTTSGRRVGAAVRMAAMAAVLTAGPVAWAGDWPGWRGPRGDGTCDETGIPVKFSPTENVVWKVPVPGNGHSSPVIVGDKILLTTCVVDDKAKTGKRSLLCLDRRDGKTLWERELFTGPLEDKHGENSFASSTPASDGKAVFVTYLAFPQLWVAAFDLDGKEIWKKNPGRFYSKHGHGCSPVLHKGLVIVNGDQDDPRTDFRKLKEYPPAEAYLVAFDKATGEETWRADRPNRTRSYCVPILTEVDGKTQMVLSGSKCVTGYDPDTGKLLWIIDGPTEQFVASLVRVGEVLFLTHGFPKLGTMGIKVGGSGNITSTHVLWTDHKGAGYVPSPVSDGKNVYLVADNGIGSCVDPVTGKKHWTQRLGRKHHASPIITGGHVYFPDDDGNVFVLKATPEKCDIVAKIEMGEPIMASPAVSGGKLFLRTAGQLYCIGQ